MISSAIIQNHYISESLALSNVNDVEDIGFDEQLSSSIKKDVKFIDQYDKNTTLNNLLGDGKPVIINMVYFNCPRVCNFALDGVLEVVNELDSLKLGKDFKILTISFNPEETTAISYKKSEQYKNKLSNLHEDKESWIFLTGDEENILNLTKSLGFKFKKDGEEFAHPSGLIVITPEGKISRYLYGIQHNAKDLKLSLIEAADGKVGASHALNKVLLFCYEFDPIGKRYALKALQIVKAGGMITLATLVAFLAIMWKREKKII
ncbi:MAG: hypothetical protein GTO02_07110 [Candidatus Dadabacteria bacterium]|nr:hypothetical protein [Candidatus Dadabacteria bacterium]